MGTKRLAGTHPPEGRVRMTKGAGAGQRGVRCAASLDAADDPLGAPSTSGASSTCRGRNAAESKVASCPAAMSGREPTARESDQPPLGERSRSSEWRSSSEDPGDRARTEARRVVPQGWLTLQRLSQNTAARNAAGSKHRRPREDASPDGDDGTRRRYGTTALEAGRLPRDVRDERVEDASGCRKPHRSREAGKAAWAYGLRPEVT